MSDTSPTSVSNYGSSIIQNYLGTIESTISTQQSTLHEINLKNENLMKTQSIQLQQLKEIEDKEKLLLTRSRMLQISQDRNSYKK